MKCEECNNPAVTICIDCEESLCDKCSVKLHSGGNRKFHSLKKFCIKCNGVSTVFCEICQSKICHNCAHFHLGHSLTPTKRLCVYWEFTEKPRDLGGLLQAISKFAPNCIKIYGSSCSDPRIYIENAVYIESPCKFLESLADDMARDSHFGVTQALIVTKITEEALMKINSIGSAIDLFYLNPATAYSKRLGSVFLMEILIKKLKKGKILINYQEFSEKICKKYEISHLELREKCNKLSNEGKIILHSKDFGNFHLHQISLKVLEVDSTIFLAVLRSLKSDEIFPCEKAIQSRIREAFDLKFSIHDWTLLLRKMQESELDRDFTLFSTGLQFHFQYIPYEEELVYVIYPVGEQWASSDQFGDVFATKKTQEWKEMTEFLRNYFTKGNKINTLTGGKYGCAALLKHFGPESLKKLTIGKLSFMIQTAIGQDMIRYQKTLLIWTASYPVSLTPEAIGQRLQVIKDEIVKLLKSRPAGIPLAQIPVNLKRKLKFPLKITDLGFKKLKDLLKAIPEVHLCPDNRKNPLAMLNLLPATISELQQKVQEIMERNTYSITEAKLSIDLFQKYGKINWVMYNSKNLVGFIDEFCKNIKVMKVGNEYIFMGRETDKEELSISTHNSEYLTITDNDEKCNEYSFLDVGCLE